MRDGYRDPRLPDSDRVDLGLGAQYKINAKSSLDMGFQKYLLTMSLLMIRDDLVNWVRSAVVLLKPTQPCSVYLTIERSDLRCKKKPCISMAFFLLVRTNRQLLI